MSPTQSERQANILRAAYAAVNDRDLDRVASTVDERVQLDVSRISPDQGIYHGMVGIRSYFEEVWAVASAFAFEIEELIEERDSIIAALRIGVEGAKSGASATGTLAAAWTFVDERVTAIRLFMTLDEARDAAAHNT